MTDLIYRSAISPIDEFVTDRYLHIIDVPTFVTICLAIDRVELKADANRLTGERRQIEARLFPGTILEKLCSGVNSATATAPAATVLINLRREN